MNVVFLVMLIVLAILTITGTIAPLIFPWVYLILVTVFAVSAIIKNL